MLTSAFIFTGLVFAGAAQAQGAGIYEVTGATSQGATYRGTISITRSGNDTWRLTWNFGNVQHEGFGIGKPGYLSVHFRSSQGDGVVSYKWNGTDAYEGRWAYRNQTDLGWEKLLKKP